MFCLLAFTATSEAQYPSESSHQITVALNRAGATESLQMSLVWPVATDSIQTNMSDDHCRVHLTVKKSIYEPWPGDFCDRSKWRSGDCLPPWHSLHNRGDLAAHALAQFSFPDQMNGKFEDSKAGWFSLSGVDMVRVIIRRMLDAVEHSSNSDCLATICGSTNESEGPVWYLRVHGPIRASPAGCPVLILSALDRRLSRKLIRRGLRNAETDAADIERLTVGVPSCRILVMFIYTEEQSLILRYVLRLNSSKIRPNPWQEANIPLGRHEPWLATFLSPLYVDNRVYPSSECSMKSLGIAQSSITCTYCFLVSEDVKRCSRCKSVKYCSAKCQRADWYRHKTSCSK